MPSIVEKVLSANDTGETGGHQAGLLVPRDNTLLSFFPALDGSLYNPRCIVEVRDEAGEEWTFNYIYYNNALFGGTRNEYRLTGMTQFIRRHALKAGDVVIFQKTNGRLLEVRHRRKEGAVQSHSTGRKLLRLTGKWIVLSGDE